MRLCKSTEGEGLCKSTGGVGLCKSTGGVGLCKCIAPPARPGQGAAAAAAPGSCRPSPWGRVAAAWGRAAPPGPPPPLPASRRGSPRSPLSPPLPSAVGRLCLPPGSRQTAPSLAGARRGAPRCPRSARGTSRVATPRPLGARPPRPLGRCSNAALGAGPRAAPRQMGWRDAQSFKSEIKTPNGNCLGKQHGRPRSWVTGCAAEMREQPCSPKQLLGPRSAPWSWGTQGWGHGVKLRGDLLCPGPMCSACDLGSRIGCRGL